MKLFTRLHCRILLFLSLFLVVLKKKYGAANLFAVGSTINQLERAKLTPPQCRIAPTSERHQKDRVLFSEERNNYARIILTCQPILHEILIISYILNVTVIFLTQNQNVFLLLRLD